MFAYLSNFFNHIRGVWERYNVHLAYYFCKVEILFLKDSRLKRKSLTLNYKKKDNETARYNTNSTTICNAHWFNFFQKACFSKTSCLINFSCA